MIAVDSDSDSDSDCQLLTRASLPPHPLPRPSSALTSTSSVSPSSSDITATRACERTASRTPVLSPSSAWTLTAARACAAVQLNRGGNNHPCEEVARYCTRHQNLGNDANQLSWSCPVCPSTYFESTKRCTVCGCAQPRLTRRSLPGFLLDIRTERRLAFQRTRRRLDLRPQGSSLGTFRARWTSGSVLDAQGTYAPASHALNNKRHRARTKKPIQSRTACTAGQTLTNCWAAAREAELRSRQMAVTDTGNTVTGSATDNEQSAAQGADLNGVCRDEVQELSKSRWLLESARTPSPQNKHKDRHMRSSVSLHPRPGGGIILSGLENELSKGRRDSQASDSVLSALSRPRHDPRSPMVSPSIISSAPSSPPPPSPSSASSAARGLGQRCVGRAEKSERTRVDEPGKSGKSCAGHSCRVRWSRAEEEQLEKGVEQLGLGNWNCILHRYTFHAKRTNVDLKDKWRNMRKKARKPKK